MNTEQLKQQVAAAAIDLLPQNSIIGIGTGSTVNYFIAELAKIKHSIQGTVASSIATEKLLKSHNIPVYELNTVEEINIYVDGADEFNNHCQ